MPHIVTLLSSPISTGNYSQMRAAGVHASTTAMIPSGEIECWFRNDSATAVNVVFNVDNATDAGTEQTNSRYIPVPGSATVLIPFRLDPSRTWIRSTGAAHGSLFAIMKW